MTNKLGWRTTVANRKSMLSALDTAVRLKQIFPSSTETLTEMRSFVTKPNGKPEAGPGHKDDRVLSLGIANQMLAAATKGLTFNLDEPQKFDKPSSYQPSRSIYAYLQRKQERISTRLRPM